MIFIGAAAVLVAGGALVDDVQGSSQHELAVDSAVQTHQAISEALQSGEARQLAVSDGVDMEIVESGSISIEMTDGDNACSNNVDGVAPVSAEMGAIVYDTPKGAVIYQGGAIWEKMGGGLSIQRSPPISYDNETARISIQTVTADSDSFDGQMAMPNETMQATKIEETNQMLSRCPANGFTGLRINVTSPEYADMWEQHFKEQVDGGPDDAVDIGTPGDSVVANISNATNPHASRGLRFGNVTAPSVIKPGNKFTNEFFVNTKIANDGFAPREANVSLHIDGIGTRIHSSSGTDVSPGGSVFMNFTHKDDGAPLQKLTWGKLQGKHALALGQLHDYTVILQDGAGNNVSTTTGKFYLAEAGSGNLSLAEAPASLDAANDSLSVNATLVNTMMAPEIVDEVSFTITDSSVDMTSETATDINVSGYGGVTNTNFNADVSSLPAGIYEYRVGAKDGGFDAHKNGTFVIRNRTQGNLVDNLLVTSVDASDTMVSTNDPFSVALDVTNLGLDLGEGDLSLDVEGVPEVPGSVDGLPPSENTTESLTLTPGELDTLSAGQVHNYTVTLAGDSGQPFVTNGSFYLGHSNDAPRLENVSDTFNGTHVTINATVSNHGLSNYSNPVTLDLSKDGESVGSDSTSVSLSHGANQTVSFGFNASDLSGRYNYTIGFGGRTDSGSVDVGGVESGDGGVSIKAPGNGSVTVLGTEISAEWGSGDDWTKQWAPIGASVISERNGNQNVHRFDNSDRTSVNLAGNPYNLNTYDTQTDKYSWNWTQGPGDMMNLTVGATYWDDGCGGYRFGDEHTRNGEGYFGQRTYLDRHPSDEFYVEYDQYWNGNRYVDYVSCTADSISVNASKGVNPSNVKVLTAGDTVPDTSRGYPDQRTAVEILNDGAANRIDPDTHELLLNPNEAVFFFELTDPNANWDDAKDPSSSVDYNDAIAIVEFTPANPETEVNFSVSNGNMLSISTGSPNVGEDDENESIDDVSSDTDESADGEPSIPEPQSPDPGNPSGPDEIDVDVGGIVIG